MAATLVESEEEADDTSGEKSEDDDGNNVGSDNHIHLAHFDASSENHFNASKGNEQRLLV